MSEPRPQDLVRLARPAELVPATAPAWVEPALRAAPWVVVRRARTPPRHVPAGVRGRGRAERYALQVPVDNVVEVLPPDALIGRADALPDLPAARALHAVRPLLDATGLCWGPGGSVGFELATGLPTVTADSDLDLVIRVGRLPLRAELIALHAALRRLPARADCQLDTPAGALALAELVSGADQVLLRTATGPHLVPVP